MPPRLKKLVIALAILGLLGFVANLLVDNPYTHRLIRVAINEKVRQHTNLVVDFKAIKASVVPPGVDLYGFYLATDTAPNEPLVTASHARARISVWALIFGELKLASLETNDLTVVWPPPYGFKGFLKETPGAPEPPPAPLVWPPPFELPVERIELKNTRLYAEVPLMEKIPEAPAWAIFSAIGLDLELTVDGWRDIEVALDVHSANVTLDASSMIEETAVEVRAELVGDVLTVRRLKLDGERLKLDGGMAAELQLRSKKRILDAVTIAAQADVQGDFSVLGSFLDLPDTRGAVVGKVKVDARVPIEDTARPDPTYLITGEGKLTDAYLDGFRLFNSRASFEINDAGIKFPDVDLIIGEQQVAKVSGAITFNDAMDFDWRGAPVDLKLSDLLDALGVDFGLIDTYLTAPDLRVWGNGNAPFKLNVAATAQASEVTLPANPYDHSAFPESLACRLDLHLAIDSAKLDFGGTNGICFQPNEAPGVRPPGPAAQQLKPPPRGTRASPIAVEGKVHTEGPTRIDLRIASDALDLGLAEYFAQVPFAGTAKIRTRIHGLTDKIAIDNDVVAQGLKISGIPLGNAAALATYSGGEVVWRDAVLDMDGKGRATSPGGSLLVDDELRIKGTLATDGIGSEAMERILAAAAPGLPLSFGLRTAKASIEGPALHPLAWRGTVELAVEEMLYDGERLLDEARATLKSDATGWSTHDLVAMLGDLTVTAELRHQRAFPFSLAEAEGSGNTLARLGLHPDDKVEISLKTLEPERPQLGGARRGGPLAALPSDSRLKLARIDHLGDLPFAGRSLREAGIGGRIALGGKLTGTLDDLQGTFDGALAEPTVFGSVQSPVNIRGFVKGGKIDLMLTHAGNALEGRLSLDVGKDGVPYEWFLSLNRMDLRALGTEALHADPRNFLYVSATWRMRGELTDWWRSTGELEIKDIRAKYVQDVAAQTRTLQIRQEQPVTLLFRQDGWRFDSGDLYLSGRHVQIRVSMDDTRPPDRLGIKLEGVIDMAVAKEFSQSVDTASGKVRVVAEIKGPVDDLDVAVEVTDLKPNPFIAATWTPVTIGLADLRPAFRNVRMRVVYRDGRLVIDSLAADKGTGTVTASGSLNLKEDGGEESRLDVALNDATLIYPIAFLKSFEAQVSGNVSVSGRGAPYRVTGDIRVGRARSTSEIDIEEEVVKALQRQRFTAGVGTEKPLVQLDLSITADQTINIHNRSLQALLSSALQIRGTDVAPVVSGQVEVNKGRFIYRRDFQITRGLFVFDDPVKPDPSLDIVAVSDVDAYRVYVSVSGRASDPKIDFAVDPPTREDGSAISKVEILVLLSRGKLPEANRSIGEATGSTAASEAINLGGSLVFGQLEDVTGRLLNLSGQSVVRNVYIDTHPSPEGQPVPRVNLPLDLGEEFDVVVRADQSANEVSTEYSIHDNITFSGTLERRNGEAKAEDQNGSVSDTKLNLKFRFSFE